MADRSQADVHDSGPEPIESELEFDRHLKSTERVLVSFAADWCGPCQSMEPVLRAVAADVEASVVEVDVDTLPQLANRFDVNSIPTYLSFHECDLDGRLVGSQTEAALRDLVE